MKELEFMRKIETKDIYTYKHLKSLEKLTSSFADFLNFNKDDKEALRLATIYHDAGKLFIDNGILNKTDRLTEEEFEIMKNHTVLGINILDDISNDHKKIIKECMLNHHYLNGYSSKKASEISNITKIISICDIYEALTSERQYKKAFSREKSLSILKEIYKKNISEISYYENFKNFLKVYC